MKAYLVRNILWYKIIQFLKTRPGNVDSSSGQSLEIKVKGSDPNL